jgi:hypothetical protein
MLAGTDNDYSVTQDAGSVQCDVYSKPLPAGGVSRIRCDIGNIHQLPEFAAAHKARHADCL